MARLTISLDEDLKSKLENEANNRNRSISSLTAHIVELYFEAQIEDANIHNEIKSLKSQVQTLKDEIQILKNKVNDGSDQPIKIPSDIRGRLIQRYPDMKSQIQHMTDEDIYEFLLEEGVMGQASEIDKDQLKEDINQLTKRFDKLQEANNSIENELKELTNSINKLLDN